MSASPTRRQVVKTAVWTVPVVAGVGAIPTYAAASGPSADITAGASCKHDGTFGTFHGRDLYKYHLTVHCVSTYGTDMTFTVGSITTGGTPANNYSPNALMMPNGVSDQVIEVLFDVVATDPIILVGFLNSVQYTLTFSDFSACDISLS